MKNLHLTSPHTSDPAVKQLQKELGGANHWKKNFRPGRVDGSYGQGTAGAVSRAKFYMGYPRNKTGGGTADVKFQQYLMGTKKLPKAYALLQWKRRKAAAAAAAKVPMRLKALKLAASQVGVKESPPGSNRVKYSVWYGLIGPWCAMFCTWCYVSVGSKVFKRGAKWAYVPYILAATLKAGSGVTRTADPQPGDLVLYDWGHDGTPDHIGLFEKWISKRAGTFAAYEGNTSAGNNSNGGQVQHRSDRVKSEVRAFVKVHG